MTNLPVGSGQTYSTFEGALAAIPSTWVDDYTVQLKDLAEYVYSANVSYSISTGTHTPAGHTLTIVPDAGKAFKDNIVPGTDALKYNSAKGVCFRNTHDYTILLQINCSSVTMSDIMFKNDGSNGSVIDSSSTSDNNTFRRLIIDSNSGNGGNYEYAFKMYGVGTLAENILIFNRGSSSHAFHFGGGSGVPVCRFVTCVRDSGKSANRTGFIFAYNGSLNNSLAFNYTTPALTGWTGTNGHNATDVATSGLPGSSNVYSLANPFVSSAAASLDLSIKAGAGVIALGVFDAACTTDILGQTRANPPTIGCYEYIAAAGPTFPPVPAPMNPYSTILTM